MTKSSHFRTTLVATAALLAAGGAQAASVPPTVLYNFPGRNVGYGPAGVTQAGGLLYGTLAFGGAANSGSVYSLNPATNAVTVLYGFGAAGSGDGAYPAFPPVVLNGVLYGTTQSGGSAGMGSVFAIDLSTNTETFLTSFLGGTHGWAPQNLVALNGTLYGTTLVGGTLGVGTLFSINPTTGAKTILYNFLGGADGSNPGNLAVLNGTLYGTTVNASSVFQFNTATNTKTIIYSFPQAGAAPSGPPLIVGTMLYGVTSSGFITAVPGAPGGFTQAGIFNNAGVMEYTNSLLFPHSGYVPLP
jgi:uncharacterized repeat protein (TIGR03803 family)